jgi:sigma-B regulation protein RsbU (phosphoserine phosphatase)
MKMKLLVAEDEPVSRHVLQSILVKWGYEVVVACDGVEAWQILQREDAPSLAILDWMMPGMDGIEVCQKVRGSTHLKPIYIILLTAKDRTEDLVLGLQAGADDYIAKPFDVRELRARLQVGLRVVELQRALADRVKELEVALSNVKQLQGLLPICCYCKKVRNDQNYWEQVEQYISGHSEVQFSHGVCPDCYQKIVKPEFEKLKPLG